MLSSGLYCWDGRPANVIGTGCRAPLAVSHGLSSIIRFFDFCYPVHKFNHSLPQASSSMRLSYSTPAPCARDLTQSSTVSRYRSIDICTEQEQKRHIPRALPLRSRCGAEDCGFAGPVILFFAHLGWNSSCKTPYLT